MEEPVFEDIPVVYDVKNYFPAMITCELVAGTRTKLMAFLDYDTPDVHIPVDLPNAEGLKQSILAWMEQSRLEMEEQAMKMDEEYVTMLTQENDIAKIESYGDKPPFEIDESIREQYNWGPDAR
jgi:hypothetical protein